MNELRRIVVVPYDPTWPAMFREEAARLQSSFGQTLVAVHHVGSTAVPGLPAKPIIDMLPEVSDIEAADELSEALGALGYLAWGEYGLPGRRYFTKGGEIHRTHQLHCYQRGNPEIERHLAFRDYLIAHPEEATAYGRLKTGLAKEFPADIVGYMDGKDAWIKDTERKALAWKQEQ